MFFFLIKAPSIRKSYLGARYPGLNVSVGVVAGEEHRISAIWELAAGSLAEDLHMWCKFPRKYWSTYKLLGVGHSGLSWQRTRSSTFSHSHYQELSEINGRLAISNVPDLKPRISQICACRGGSVVTACSEVRLASLLWAPLRSSLRVSFLYYMWFYAIVNDDLFITWALNCTAVIMLSLALKAIPTPVL